MDIRFICAICILCLSPLQMMASDPEFLEQLHLNQAEKQWLEQGYTIKVHPDTWPPFNFWDDAKNKNRGIAPDYLRWISEKTGLKFEYTATQMSLDMLFKDLMAKNVDMSPSLQYQPERALFLEYTDPYFKSRFGFFVNESTDLSKLPDSLNNIRISCEKSSTTFKFLQKHYPAAVIVECPTEKDGLLLVSQGSVLAHAGSVDVCEYLIGMSDAYESIELWQELPLDNQYVFMAVRKDWPELASIINKSLKIMPLATKNAIVKQYQRELIWKKNRHYILISGFLVLIALTVMTVALILLYKKSQKAAKCYQSAKEKAEESTRFKSAFLANMSHEIRSPMNAILGLTSLLKSNAVDASHKDQYLTYIEKSGQKLLRLINDILDFSKLESGEIALEIETFELRQLLDEVYQIFFPLALEKRINFEIDYDLPSAVWFIKSDRVKIIQVLSNLVSNAIKYTVMGEVKLGVTLCNHHRLRFFVKDTGIGIPEHLKHQVFERFKRLDQTKQVTGTGLGLSISKGLVELLGGNIWVEDNAHRGSVFIFELPYHKPTAQPVPTAQPEISEYKPYQFQQQTILVAEDQDYNFVFIAQVLKNAGLQVVRAQNGKEAIELVDQHAVDLVLMDIKMPIKSGYDATKEIKRAKPQLPVIIQSAYALPEEKEKAFQYGCDDYLTKPLEPELLLSRIARFLHKDLPFSLNA
ncbi:MAG: ATP-binding protein [Candidatus Cyclobacteriaceae bacterium M3_2C_046]